MRTHRWIVAGVAACLSGSLAHAEPAKTDLPALAERIVTAVVPVKEGNVVQILAGPDDLALAEEVATAVYKHGGAALIQYRSERLLRNVLANVPAKYDSQPRKVELALAKVADVIIDLTQFDGSLAGSISAERQTAMSKAYQPVQKATVARKTRLLQLGNDFRPFASRAKDMGVTAAELERAYWAGIGADVTGACAKLETALAKGKELTITHPNGTNLTLPIRGKKVWSADGVVTDAEAKHGGPAVSVWLPAGEVYVMPGPGTGTYVDDTVFQGTRLVGLTATLDKGKVTTISAKSGWDTVKPHYDQGGKGAMEIGGVDFGCNSAVSTKLDTFIPAGNVSIWLGNNSSFGGPNTSSFMLAANLQGATVKIDGTTVIDAGVLE